jgi:hypothetical protein
MGLHGLLQGSLPFLTIVTLITMIMVIVISKPPIVMNFLAVRNVYTIELGMYMCHNANASPGRYRC